MKAHDLDALLDETCPRCRRPFRFCECGTGEHASRDVDEETVAQHISSTWMSRGTDWDAAIGMREWSRYRRAQERRRA